MIRLLCSALTVLILTGCAAATPLLVAEAGGHQLARYEEDLKVRAAAALREEPDLLTFSVQAISRGKTEDAVSTYMKGYTNPDYSSNMKSLAIYQIALLYMNRYNDQRDDSLALQYFNRHVQEFPDSRLRGKVQQRIRIIEARRNEPVQLPATQLLKQVNRAELLKTDNTPFDMELTPMSERAITEGRTADAEAVYLILYDNRASAEEMRAKALYQLGLIYMSPYNQQGDNRKALTYFRKITAEFPRSSVYASAERRISELINRQ